MFPNLEVFLREFLRDFLLPNTYRGDVQVIIV